MDKNTVLERLESRYVEVDGLKTRYVEEGDGPVVLLVHGASLGSSLEVYEDSMPALAKAGMRAVALDVAGYGLTENPKDFHRAYNAKFIEKFLDALEIDSASFVGHSGHGALVAQVALNQPERVEKVVLVAATSLLPPLPNQTGVRGGQSDSPPPSLESVRTRLERDIHNKQTITEGVVQRRLAMSAGKNFEAELERLKTTQGGGAGEGPPLWQRFVDSPVPKLYLFGREDRGNAAKRCALLKEVPGRLKVELIDACGHLVMLDQPEEFVERTINWLST